MEGTVRNTILRRGKKKIYFLLVVNENDFIFSICVRYVQFTAAMWYM